MAKGSGSGVDTEERIVELRLVVQEGLADLVDGRSTGRVVWVVGVATEEYLVAVARWVEEVNRMARSDGVTGGAGSCSPMTVIQLSTITGVKQECRDFVSYGEI